MKRNKTPAAIGIALITAGALVASSLLFPYAAELADSDYSDYVRSETNSNNDATEGSFPEIDWGALLAENPDVVGWVRVEGTPIDYPVVQARADDPQRYLDHSLDGSWNGHGTPYVDAACDDAHGRVVLAYGHNMLDGSMFSAFANFADQTFFEGHREILFLTPERNYRLSAVAAREVSANDHHPRTDFANAAELSAFLNDEASESLATGNLPGEVTRLFEFVCCSYGTANGRTIVYAVDPTATNERGGRDASHGPVPEGQCRGMRPAWHRIPYRIKY